MVNGARQKATRRMANALDEAVSYFDTTESRDIPDHPWSCVREMFEIVGVKKDSW